MDIELIIALILGGAGVIGGSIPLAKKIYESFRVGGANFKTARLVWSEHKDDILNTYSEIEEVINQSMIMSKAVDRQSDAIKRINDQAILREALIKTASELGPQALEDLSKLLRTVPEEMELLGGIELDKLTKLKEAQREGLSKKEATNRVLGESGKMARAGVDLMTKVVPVLNKLGK